MKVKNNLFILVYVVLTSLLFLFGCSPNALATSDIAEIPLSTQTSESTEGTPTQIPTHTETPVPSSTPSLTPTITDTPTITPSPTPNMVMPGNYYVGKCANAPGQYGATITFCVNGVRVTDDRHMFFDVRWSVEGIPTGVTVTKRSDYGNRKMYLTDNLGNRYDHVNGGGAAYKNLPMINSASTTSGGVLYGPMGWFEFPSPPVGALKFDFHDDDNHLIVQDIVLIPGYGYIQYDTLSLDQYPLIVQYDEDKWDPAKAEDNTNMLTHKTIPSCTIQPRLISEPAGKFKSLTAVGDIDYKIYGYFDDALNSFIREYVYDSGIKELDPSIKPFFYVTIPADKSLECIVAVNNVLSRLAIPDK